MGRAQAAAAPVPRARGRTGPPVASVRARGLAPPGMRAGAGIGLLGEAVGFPAALLGTALLTRHLGAEAFGALGLALAASSPVAWVLANLYHHAAVALVPASPAPLDAAGRLVRAAAAWGLVGWLVFAAAAWPLAARLGYPEAAAIFALAGGEILLLPLARVHRAALIAVGRYAAPGLASGLFFAARLGLTALVVAAGGGALAAVGAVLLARGAEIAWCRTRAAFPLRPRGPAPEGAKRGLFGALFLYAACRQVVLRLDIMLLAALGAPAAAVGHFAAAQQLAVAPSLAASVVAPLLAVALARAHAAGDAAEGHRVDRRGDALAAVGAAAILGSAGLAPLAAPILFGAAFASAAGPLGWLLAGAAGTWLLTLAGQRWIARGRPAWPLSVGVVGLLVAAPAHVLAIRAHGAVGAAAVTGLVEIAAGLALHLALPGARLARAATVASALACGAALALGGWTLLGA